MPNEKSLSKLALINALRKCPPEARSRVIPYLNSEGIQVISEVIFNVLFNDSPLTKTQKRRIKKLYSKDKNLLKELSKRSGSFKKKRKLMKQHGGMIGTLLGIKTHFKKTERSILMYFVWNIGIAASLLAPLIFGHS